ncbi:MAG: NADH:flavin oxidoreductase [Pseudomonadota bacterium]
MNLFTPLDFPRGPRMKNRFMLAPLTNSQSHEDGVLSDEEYRWLTMRAEGGFGLTMTCAAHVQAIGKGFPGQLGVWSDSHLEGLTRLAARIKACGSVAIVQLHHAGMRSPADLIGTEPVCPSADEETGARGLTHTQVQNLRDDFIAAAVRAERAGFDGVELHGAHGYILCQFFSAMTNRRDDEYGGSLANRYRILDEIIEGVRAQCRDDFILGVRLSPERFGLHLDEVKQQAQRLMTGGALDFLDMSLWDVFKQPEEDTHQDKSLLGHFVELPRGATRLGVAGKIRTPADAGAVLDAGCDWVMLGRAAILHHNFPQLVSAGDFTPVALPVTREYLESEGLSEKFVDYMSGWPGFVA